MYKRVYNVPVTEMFYNLQIKSIIWTKNNGKLVTIYNCFRILFYSIGANVLLSYVDLYSNNNVNVKIRLELHVFSSGSFKAKIIKLCPTNFVLI